jgi:aryl-alcohol dehydrogenase-like predicted oxidoreductase
VETVDTRLAWSSSASCSRRDFLATASVATTSLLLAPLAACGNDPLAPSAATAPGAAGMSGSIMSRVIPASGELIPVIGMGTSGTFEVGMSPQELDPLREVLSTFVASGATVIDTAPTYGSAEDVLGALLAEVPSRAGLFLATKLSGVTGRAAGLAQFDASLRRLRTDRVALLQVHNLRDTDAQFKVARELQERGKTRYVGLTHYVESAQPELAQAMRRLKPDFVQINYSPVSRGAERSILPLAQELGIAVMINRTFEDGQLFAQVRGKPLPGWASDVGATSWAQLFLKFVLSQPAVTVVIPATSKRKNMVDNLGAGVGALLDARQRADLIAQLG